MPEMNFEQEMHRVRDEILAAVGDVKKHVEVQVNLGKAATMEDVQKALALSQLEVKALNDKINEMHAKQSRNGFGGYDSPELQTPGERFAKSDAVRELREQWVKGKRAFMQMEGTFHDHRYQQKTTITSTAVGNSTPGILVPERVGGLIVTSDRRQHVRDLLARGTTTGNTVEWVKVNAFTNNASTQTEASDKQESALTFVIDYAPVRTIAHWIPATRQVLDDWSQLQGYIDNRLLYGLALKEDSELLFGDGLGVHLTGLMTDATAVAGTYAVAADTYIDKILNALNELETASEYIADGIILNPSDWRKIQKVKEEQGGANTGPYIMGGPRTQGPLSIWDTPVVTTTAMTAGRFLVGNFQIAAQIFDRQGSTIDISTEHSDYFIKNMVAIRAEQRLALVVYVPGAMRAGTF